MSSVPARERLNRLVELATATGPGDRCELTNEVANLLLDWPSAYPEAMREPFEALLERSLADIDPEARALLAERFAQRPGVPLSVLNAFVFDASPELRAEIILRNRGTTEAYPSNQTFTREAALLSGIRAAQLSEIARGLSSHLDIPLPTAARIVSDASALTLAALCRGWGLSRPTFSALAVLSRPFADADEHYGRLAAYEDVPEDAARSLLAHWRRQADTSSQATQAA